MPYTVEIARPVYRRTERYGEGLGLDDAIKAAQETAGQASADLAEVVRGEPFVAAVRLDGKPVEAPRDHTEYFLLKWAAELERFRQEQNVLGSKCPYDGAFRVRGLHCVIPPPRIARGVPRLGRIVVCKAILRARSGERTSSSGTCTAASGRSRARWTPSTSIPSATVCSRSATW